MLWTTAPIRLPRPQDQEAKFPVALADPYQRGPCCRSTYSRFIEGSKAPRFSLDPEATADLRLTDAPAFAEYVYVAKGALKNKPGECSRRFDWGPNCDGCEGGRSRNQRSQECNHNRNNRDERL